MARKNPIKSAAIFLVSIAALALITFYLVLPKVDEFKEEEKNSQLLFKNLKRNQILEIKVNNRGIEGLHLQRQADSKDWILSPFFGGDSSSSRSFGADPTSVNGMISSILASKDDGPVNASDYKKFELDKDNAIHVEIVTSSKKKYSTLLIGMNTPVNYFAYAKWADKNEVFLVSRTLKLSLDKKIEDLRDKKLLNIAYSDMSEINIETRAVDNLKSQKLKFQRSGNGIWKSNSSTRSFELDSEEIQSWINRLNEDLVSKFLNDESAKKLNLKESEKIVDFSFHSEKQKQDWELFLRKDGDNKKYYVKEKEQNEIFQSSSLVMDQFRFEIFKFRPKKLTDLDNSKIKKMLFKSPKGSYQIVRTSDEQWELKKDEQSKGTPVKRELVIRVLTPLRAMTAVKYHDDAKASELGLENPVRDIQIISRDGKDLAAIKIGKALSPEELIVATKGFPPASIILDSKKIPPASYEDVLSLQKELDKPKDPT